jgi:hypothetical protein
MCRKRWIALWAAMALAAAGCGQASKTNEKAEAAKTDASAGNPTAQAPADGPTKGSIRQTAAKLDGPAATVFDFLEAARTGNDAKGLTMLTAAAREKNHKTFKPSASDTAAFQVGQVEYKADDLAAVSSAWTDLNEDGEKDTQEAVWMVRREPEGWRVGGVAATVIAGKAPILLNFEDPEDMARQRQKLREELDRQEREEELQAQGRPAPDAHPLRR